MTTCVLSALKQKKDITVLGTGSHYKLNSTEAIKDTLSPFIQRLSAAGISSKLLIAAVHSKKNFAHGGKKFKERILRYNVDVEEWLRPWGVPVFDTFNLTDGSVLSLDGSHYGMGVNRAKANGLLHYFLELQNKGIW
ncbi:hypothetical protein ACOMHN_039548 [Nucella lapillus]